ncbi:hypothetical protein AAHH67_12290 [Niallia circulans]|uniref:hypothetical protein n=1 Tax=Priestia flexa TaxID=86664 RepID=UPI001CFD3D34|nr:hypothetical protein [Priestia flexa]
MKIFKNIILAVWLTGMLAVYILMFWTAAFPYNEEEHRKAEIARERAEQRAKAIKNLQEEYIKEHH